MRESIGAGSIFSIVVVFIVLFTSYLAISVNYAKTFKIKNHIVTMIENSEGYGQNISTRTSGQNIERYLTAEGYTSHGRVPCDGNYNGSGDDQFEMVACIGGNNGGSNFGPASVCSNSNASADCAVAIFRVRYTSTTSYSGTNIDINNPTCVDVNNSSCCAHRSYYRVITFFEFNLPIIRNITTFPVRGDTKTIYDYSHVSGC